MGAEITKKNDEFGFPASSNSGPESKHSGPEFQPPEEQIWYVKNRIRPFGPDFDRLATRFVQLKEVRAPIFIARGPILAS
jgi:hypothetical protein